MRKNLTLALATLIAILAFCACSKNDCVTAQGDEASQVISLTTSVRTRSIDQTLQESQIAEGIHVGAFVATTGSTSEFMENALNNDLTADGNGDLSVASGKEMYFPAGANVDIYAYAPYNSGWSSLGVQTFTVQTDQSTDANVNASDLLYVKKADVASTSDAIALEFAHKLSKLNITIVNSSSIVLKDAVVSVLGTKTSVKVDLSSGALTDNDEAVAADITAATLGESDLTASAILVPQEVSSGHFLKIVTSADNNNSVSTTLYADLAEAKTLAANHKYNYKVTITGTPEIPNVQLSLGSTTVGSWEEEGSDLTSLAYGVGDFVLSNGGFLKASEITTQNKSLIAGVIFSTTVSAADEAAGYNAYAMGLTRMKNRTWGFTDEITTGPTSLAEGIADLDGRTKTSSVTASTPYTTYAESNSNHIATLSGYSPTLTGTNLSGWFVPSFGQIVQILNNLGQANITDATMTAASFGTSSSFYVYSNDTSEGKVAPETIISNLNTYVVTQAGKSENVITAGNITVATISESAQTKFWSFNLTDNGESWELGAAAGKTSNANRSVIPCLAVTIPTTTE